MGFKAKQYNDIVMRRCMADYEKSDMDYIAALSLFLFIK